MNDSSAVSKRAIAWISVVVWMAVIFMLSATPDLRSGLQPLWDRILRKAAHVTEYAILSWLIVRAGVASGWSRRRALAIGLVAALLYAGTDEWHQTFIPGRNGNPLDWGVDAAGAAIGTALHLRRKRSAW